MNIKDALKKGLWCLLALGMSALMVLVCREAWSLWRECPDYPDLVSMQAVLFFLPLWLLSLLGAARSFLGENWFPLAQKIPPRVAKAIFIAAGILLVAAGAVYEARTRDSYPIRHIVYIRFQMTQYFLKLILFYTALLLVEQWGLRRGRTLREIRKLQLWFAVAVALGLLIWEFLMGVQLWYTPLKHVYDWNDEEDYMLWWFSLFDAVFLLPFFLLAARKMVRQFRGDHWLPISSHVPKPMTGLLAAAFLGLTVWQARESSSYFAFLPESEIPEHTRAAAMGHMFQAMIWGVALFWALCMFVKQVITQRKGEKNHGTDAENR